MASPEHLKILQRGSAIWNDWRRSNPNTIPELSQTDLRGFKFSDFNLREAQFMNADLREADFSGVSATRANLSNANLNGACFKEADFSDSNLCAAKLIRADFFLAICVNADFSESELQLASLRHADFCRANFRAANLSGAILNMTKLDGANFENVVIGGTIFAWTDFAVIQKLESVQHYSPSHISFDTLLQSNGKIPEKFLRDAGFPDTLVTYLPSLFGTVNPIQWYSCFISYSTKNQEFAERLHSRMRQAGLRVWFDREDMKGGEYLHTQIDRAIQLHDRLLLVLSEDSIQSKWVEREIRKTRKVERAEKRRKLFPITLTDYVTLKKWECLDSDTGEDLAEEVRKYHIPDFSNWKNHDAFEKAFARLEKDLRTSIGK